MPASRCPRAARSRRSRSAAGRPKAGASSTSSAIRSVAIDDRRQTAARPRNGGLPSRPSGCMSTCPFCVSICPYCDFVVYAGADARGPRNRIDAAGRRPDRRDRPAGRGRRSRPGRPAPGHGLPRRRHPVAPARGRPGPDHRRGAGRIRDRARSRGHARGEPWRRRARRSGRPGRRGNHPAEHRCPVVRAERAQAPRPAPFTERHRAGPDRGSRGGHRLDQPGPAVRRAGPDPGQLGGQPRAGDRPRPGPPVALRPDPRRSGRRGADRSRWRSPGADRRGAPLA